jgi:hypothetical protein
MSGCEPVRLHPERSQSQTEINLNLFNPVGVTPAKAGVQAHAKVGALGLDSRFRGNDGCEPSTCYHLGSFRMDTQADRRGGE